MCGHYPRALKLFLQCGDREIDAAIVVVGKANSDTLTHQLIDFLVGEKDGVPKDPNYIYRLYMALKKYEDVDKMLEKALDSLIFNKYIILTRIQATNTSIKMCNQRIDNHHFQDDKLLKYANFLITQYEQA